MILGTDGGFLYIFNGDIEFGFPIEPLLKTEVSETAAKILFSTADWARKEEVEEKTFRLHWRQLFLLGCAQYMTELELEQLWLCSKY